jgi:hypothetical protein
MLWCVVSPSTGRWTRCASSRNVLRSDAPTEVASNKGGDQWLSEPSGIAVPDIVLSQQPLSQFTSLEGGGKV